MGWRRILAFCVACEVKMKPVKGLLIRRLLINQHMKELFFKCADAPFQMEEGRSGIWREEGDSLGIEALSLFLDD